jgi:DNA-directed RNA polymerase subunit K
MADSAKHERNLTRFEWARIIGARALQIARGAPILIETNLVDPVKIAEAEFEKDVLPLDVKRRAPPRLRPA